jgi:hypothetical protein
MKIQISVRVEDDSYLTISKEEVKKRVTEAVNAVKNEKAILLNPQEYDEDMNEFMKNL